MDVKGACSQGPGGQALSPEVGSLEDTLKLPPTFFCGICSDTDEDNGNAEDFQSELQKVQEAQVRLSLAFLLAQSPLLMAIN